MVSWTTMHRLLLITILAPVPVLAQSVDDGTELLRKARSFAEGTRSWRAEVIETSQMSGRGMNLQSEVRTKIAAQPPLKMSRQNNGSDRTILVCDGIETFYSGDGHSYYKGEARVMPQCDLPLSKFYELNNTPDSISVIGRDHVRLTDGDRQCVVIRAAWKQGTVNTVRTMCIDPARPLILRDVIESEDEKSGIKSVKTTTFTLFESTPTFTPDTFRFSVPPGAVQAKPPV
jgi:outer membrane lipoprotein-sorting protein